jgi:serine/threonine protein phosphatase PrpC
MRYDQSYISDKGTRKEQEDDLFIYKNVNIHYLNDTFDIFIVSDGHLGKEANNFIGSNFKHFIETYWNNKTPDPRKYRFFFKNMFNDLDTTICYSCSTSGASISCLLINNKEEECNYLLSIGNVRTYIIHSKYLLSAPLHTLDCKRESIRFDENEIVYIAGANRYKGMTLTRSLGDKDLKGMNKIISTPFIYKFNKFERIIVYTDGFPDKIIESLNYNIIDVDHLKSFIEKKYKKIDNYTVLQITSRK